MKKIEVILLIGILLSMNACTSSDTYVQEQRLGDEEQLFTMDNLEVADFPPEWDVLLISLFSEVNANKLITARFDVDEKSGQHTMQFRVEEEMATEGTFPRLKNRGEDNEREWTYWGEVCGIMSAKRFADFLQNKYAGFAYETRFEPIEGSDCRKAYYREG